MPCNFAERVLTVPPRQGLIISYENFVSRDVGLISPSRGNIALRQARRRSLLDDRPEAISSSSLRMRGTAP
jgi:hypothetical protein